MKSIFWKIVGPHGRPLGRVLADSPALAALLAQRLYGDAVEEVVPLGPVPKADDPKVLRWPGGA